MLVGIGFTSSARKVRIDCHFLIILSHSLFVCFLLQGAPISGPLVMEKARSFFTKLYPGVDAESSKASNGWLTRFKARHGIRNIQLRGKILSLDSSAVAPFREELKKVMVDEGYSHGQLFNADETLNSSGIRSCNFKKAKERVTIMENESANDSLPDILKKVTLKNVIYWVAEAWREASNDSLRKA